MTKRIWFAWHSWLGVMSGLLMFVICWSGAFATIAKELDWLANPVVRVQAVGERASLADADAAVRANYPATEIFNTTRGAGSSFADAVLVRTDGGQLRYVYFDPYSETVTGSSSRFTIHRFFRTVHMNLFDPAGIGLFLVSTFGLVLTVSLFTALLFYKRWWRRFLELKTRKGSLAFWSSAHKVGGLWSVWFVLVIGITGVWYFFEHSRYKLVDGIVTYVGGDAYSQHALPPSGSAGESLPVDVLLNRARQLRPDIYVQLMSLDSEGYFYIDGQAGHLLVRDRANKLYLDKVTGEAVYDQTASSLPLYWRLSDTADPLHFGDFGGLATKLIWFAFGLGLSGLALTGTWLHIKRLERDKGGRAHWPGTLAAIAFTYAVIAAAAWEGWNYVKGFGPEISGVQQWPGIPLGVSAVVIAWIFLTVAALSVWTVLLVKNLPSVRKWLFGSTLDGRRMVTEWQKSSE